MTKAEVTKAEWWYPPLFLFLGGISASLCILCIWTLGTVEPTGALSVMALGWSFIGMFVFAIGGAFGGALCLQAIGELLEYGDE